MKGKIVFKADRIKIMIDTKIPGLKGPLALTRKILYIKSENENENEDEFSDDFPLFTGHCKLNKSFLMRKSRENLIDYFFSEDIFEKSFDNEKIEAYDTHLD
jgi:hypothetical protein